MGTVWAIARRDLIQAFTTPLAWLVLFAWSLVLNLSFCLVLEEAVEHASGAPLYVAALRVGQWLLVLLAPAMTMNAFAAERGQATLSWLLSLPIAEGRIVLGKWLASFLLLLTLVVATLAHPLALALVSDLGGGGHLLSGYLGMILSCALFAGLGVLIAVAVESPVAAYVLTLGALLVLHLISFLAEGPAGLWMPLRTLGEAMGLGARLQGFLDGRPRLADAGWFAAMTAGCLLLACDLLRRRRDHG